MITLHIAALLANEGFGELNKDIFWEDAPLDSKDDPKEGIWVESRGTPSGRFIKTQAFDIYSRYTKKLTGSKKLEDILVYLQQAYGTVCELPTVPPHSLTRYFNVTITPDSSVDNVGKDENNKIVRVISGTIKYERN